MNDLVVSGEHYPTCPNCDLELNPWSMREPNPSHCPRCAYDLNTIDLTDALIDPTTEKQRKGLREKIDLLKMLRNWGQAYERLVGERGVDWSLPHEYLQEVAENMLPYLDRLRKTEYLTSGDIADLGIFFAEQCGKLIVAIEQEEDLLRLTGGWTDREQEIKDYWQERFSKSYGLTFQQYLQVSMRNE